MALDLPRDTSNSLSFCVRMGEVWCPPDSWSLVFDAEVLTLHFFLFHLSSPVHPSCPTYSPLPALGLGVTSQSGENTVGSSFHLPGLGRLDILTRRSVCAFQLLGLKIISL